MGFISLDMPNDESNVEGLMTKYILETEKGNRGTVTMDMELDEVPDDIYRMLTDLIDEGNTDLALECQSIVLSEEH